MFDKNNPRKLFVEGMTELRTIPELIEANGLDWEIDNGTGPRRFLVAIQSMGGIGHLLDMENLSVRLKDPTTKFFGIIVDADENSASRWTSIREKLLDHFTDLPEVVPKEGLVVGQSPSKKFGVWIMPDNESRGMLETFLAFLVPEDDNILEFAKSTCADAKNRGAQFKPVHLDKAEIYTWLAWQDEPGQQLHSAVQQRILNPTSEHAVPFVTWFRRLYEL